MLVIHAKLVFMPVSGTSVMCVWCMTFSTAFLPPFQHATHHFYATDGAEKRIPFRLPQAIEKKLRGITQSFHLLPEISTYYLKLQLIARNYSRLRSRTYLIDGRLCKELAQPMSDNFNAFDQELTFLHPYKVMQHPHKRWVNIIRVS